MYEMLICEWTDIDTFEQHAAPASSMPGMASLKSLILNARLNPLAKKPPKGAISEANAASTTACTWNHDARTVSNPSAARAAPASHPCGTVR